MSIMRRGGENGVVKEGDYVALVINYEADYGTVVEKASRLFGVNSSRCCLVHTTGSRILDRQINESGRMRSWCIRRYLASSYARSTAVRLWLLVEDEEVWSNTCSAYKL